jgi:PhnB protein
MMRTFHKRKDDEVARVSTYLNFMGTTGEAFDFYREVFGTDYLGPIQRMKDVPSDPNGPQLSEQEKEMIMHVELPILGGHVLMATDMLPSMGHELRIGNNTTINLEPDSREETQRLFDALSDGATECAPLADMFWGATWGSCLDRFGVRWMFNYMPAAE